MGSKPDSGTLFGIPYNFERPSIGRLLSAHWQPGKGMIVKKPFGIGYTLNLANWRSWVSLVVVAGLLLQERSGSDEPAEFEETADEPVEVIVEE